MPIRLISLSTDTQITQCFDERERNKLCQRVLDFTNLLELFRWS